MKFSIMRLLCTKYPNTETWTFTQFHFSFCHELHHIYIFHDMTITGYTSARRSFIPVQVWMVFCVFYITSLPTEVTWLIQIINVQLTDIQYEHCCRKCDRNIIQHLHVSCSLSFFKSLHLTVSFSFHMSVCRFALFWRHLRGSTVVMKIGAAQRKQTPPIKLLISHN